MPQRPKNPFIITFGKKPIEYIHRPYQTDEILAMFTEDPVTNQIYIIRGPRGTGKTVMLADLANQLENNYDWRVIRCAPTSDIIHAVAEGLERNVLKKDVSVDVSLNAPVIGGVHLQKNKRQSGDTYIIEDALKILKRNSEKLLVTVDEITDTFQMRNFISYFQIWMGQDYPIFFLGTALYERLEELQNVQNLTFLYRAPKIDLEPLDLPSISRTYQKVLNISGQLGAEMAQLTLGYSFAFQALGFIYWNSMPVNDLNDILPDYDAMLSNSAYSKMWQEMSEGDHELCLAIANIESSKVQDIRMALNETDSNRFNQRRIRLKNRGIIDTKIRGRIYFALPRFREFVVNAAMLYGFRV